MKQTRGLFCMGESGVALSFTTKLLILPNEFDVQSILHGQVSLAAVNHIYVFHGVMGGCKNL